MTPPEIRALPGGRRDGLVKRPAGTADAKTIIPGMVDLSDRTRRRLAVPAIVLCSVVGAGGAPLVSMGALVGQGLSCSVVRPIVALPLLGVPIAVAANIAAHRKRSPLPALLGIVVIVALCAVTVLLLTQPCPGKKLVP
jgi:hypothetical protein